MMGETRDFLSVGDLTADELLALIDAAGRVKRDPASWNERLSGRQVGLIFEKPSTRTRVSFEVAVTAMGGHAVVLRGDELQLGRGETVEDTGRVLSRYVDALVVRTFGQERLEQLATGADVPVINALSDQEHPCQSLADLQTMAERFGELQGLVVAYVGDGNNVAHSLMLAGSLAGMQVRVASPDGYEPSEEIVARCRAIGETTGGGATVIRDPLSAASGAQALYTDVWASMGQESEADERRSVFESYRLDESLIAAADAGAIVLHCLPAHRGEEISVGALEGERSAVWDQAENRLHAQKALLAWLLDPGA